MGKRSIIAEFTRSLLVGALITGTLTGFFWIMQTYQIFSSEETYLKSKEHSSAKTLARAKIDQAMNTLKYHEGEILPRIHSQVKTRVDEGILLVQGIVAQNAGKTPEEIQQAVINGLRPMRFFDGRGYYFIGSLRGDTLLYPIRPQLEGTNRLQAKDSKGQRLVAQEVALATSQGEGFVSGYWPRPQDPAEGEGRLKISYIKRLEQFDWYIGAGDYYEDFKESVRQELIRRYTQYNSNDGTRIFILSESGAELVSRYAEDSDKQKLAVPLHTEEERKAVIQEELAYSLSNPAGYSYIRTYSSAGNATYETAVYIQPMPEWGWVIGAEVPVASMWSAADPSSDEIRQRSLQTFLQILAAIVFVFVASAMILRRQSLRLRNDFMAFMTFFKQAAKENVLIDVENIQMQEFASMAHMANQMVTKRQEAEEALTAANEQLEIQVQARTQELQESLQILESTQEQMLRNEKLSVMGNVVAGLTHEISVPISIVRSLNSDMQEMIASVRSGIMDQETGTIALQALLMRMNEDSTMMEANLKRTLELVESFREVSVDQSSGKRGKFNLRDHINEVVLSLSSRIKKGNHHVEVICDSTVEIVGFPGVLSQIITNLIINSLQHGFRNRTGGHITLEVIDGGQRILLLYRDDGCGIPARSLNRVYEPFFTTDRERGGSGLGLNIVHQLVTDKLDGVINLTSTEGRGVLFEIEFPAALGE